VVGRIGLETLKELKIDAPEGHQDKKEKTKISDF
jgi:hypothetical protein